MAAKETKIKTHLIVTDIHEEYFINWNGSIANTNPIFKNNMPIFIIITNDTRIELNTVDIKFIEKTAKRLTNPHGREAVTTDIARIYIKEKMGKQTLLGTVTHNHVKTYAPMYDTVGYRD